jgi:signal transduction histidine kinase
MKVKARFSLFCSLVFGVVFIIVAIVIYLLHYRNTREVIYGKLQNIARTSALFYLEEDELNVGEFEKVRKQFDEIEADVYYQIYGNDNNICYGSEDSKVTGTIPPQILDRIREKRQASFRHEKYLCHGFFYEDNQGDFVIVAKEEEVELEKQMTTLLNTLVACFIAGLIAIVGLSRWVARIAYIPFSRIISQVQNISASDPDMRIASPGTKDELQELTDTFNNLLSRISETIIIQRNFVRYVSHEFKTPLASLLGNLEVFLIKNRTPEEYKDLSVKMIAQVKQLEEILDALMLISDLRKNVKEESEVTRLDELVWEIIEKIYALHPQAEINVRLNVAPEEEQHLAVPFERTQMLLMLFNLLENAVKYSQGKAVDILFFTVDNRLFVRIVDQGSGIKPEHINHISKPFYRADHTNRIKGSGIGLSIALRIMEKNGIKYDISSEVNKGTVISMQFG